MNRGWEVSRNTLTAGAVDRRQRFDLPPTLGEFVDFVRDTFRRTLDQVARHRAGQLIAEGHATAAHAPRC